MGLAAACAAGISPHKESCPKVSAGSVLIRIDY